MRNLFILWMTVFSSVIYAQQTNDSIGTLKKDSLQVKPPKKNFGIPVTYHKTSHLVFPSPIVYVDLGSEDIIAQKIGDIENVLRLKAAVENFKPNTNISIITQNGKLFHFEVFYEDFPSELTFDLVQNIPYNEIKSDVFFSDTHLESPAIVELIMKSIYKHQKQLVKHIGSKNAGIKSQLKSLYIHNGKLYLDIWLKNRSYLPFEVDFISFKVVDKKTTKQSLVQEISVEPLRVYEPLSVVKPKKDAHSVYMLEGLACLMTRYFALRFLRKTAVAISRFYSPTKTLPTPDPLNNFI